MIKSSPPKFARKPRFCPRNEAMLLHALRSATESGDTASALDLYAQLTGLHSRPSLEQLSSWVARQGSLGGEVLMH